MPKLFIIAGEESGDIHASNMVRQLEQLTDLSIYGTGGPRLKDLGQEQYFTSDEMTIIGLDGILRNIPLILKMFKTLKHKVEEIKPDAIILVDYPGFNLRFASKIKQLGIPIIYFISPQVWAWNYKRVHKIRKLIDKVLCILPFEEELFCSEGIDATYVGNPIVDHAIPAYDDKNNFLQDFNLIGDKKIIGILPGSRQREVLALMPEIIRAYHLLKDHYEFVLGKAESVPIELVQSFVDDTDIRIVENKPYDVMAHSDLLWACSGTTTLEIAYFKKPMIILYSVGRLTEIFAQLVIKTDYIGLPNIVFGEKIIPELLQDDMNSKNIIEATSWLFENYDEVVNNLTVVSDLFIDRNPSARAAQEILTFLEKDRNKV